MTINSSGPVSLIGTTAGQSIALEIGASTTGPLGLLDTNVRGLAGVPSGQVSMPSNFYGKSSAFTFTQTISANTQNYNLLTQMIAAGYTNGGAFTATVTINSGVYVWSDTTATAGFDTGAITGTGTITINNNGFIIGKGGNGGDSFTSAGTPVLATAGGPAMNIQRNVTINNTSYIAGGGGGGAGGSTGSGFAGGGGGAGGGNGGRGFISPGTWSAGGTGGAVGASGGSGTTGSPAGGGGGRILPGTGGASVSTSASIRQGHVYASGNGGGAGGSGGSWSFSGGTNATSSTGAAGGAANNVGGNGVSAQSGSGARAANGGGGGGGWGAAGGTSSNATATGVTTLSTQGAGGRSINLNGNTATVNNTGTIYGAMA